MYSSEECVEALEIGLLSVSTLGPILGSPWIEEWKRREKLRIASLRRASGDPLARDKAHDAAIEEVLRRGLPDPLKPPDPDSRS